MDKPVYIMLIDDDEDEDSLFVDVATRLGRGIEYRWFPGWLQARQALLEKNKQKPDIIFLDLNMPVINGIECLQNIKQIEELKYIPVFMYTTSSDPQDIRKAQTLGARAFISKCSSPSQLKNILLDIIDHRIHQNDFFIISDSAYRLK